jgi:hypothetical protein
MRSCNCSWTSWCLFTSFLFVACSCLLQLCKVGVLHPRLDLLLQFARLGFYLRHWSCASVVPCSRVSFSAMVPFLFLICCLLFATCRQEFSILGMPESKSSCRTSLCVTTMSREIVVCCCLVLVLRRQCSTHNPPLSQP